MTLVAGDWIAMLVALSSGLGTVAIGLITYFNRRIDEERKEREADRHTLRNDTQVVKNELALFRERVANEYPSYERLREMLKPLSEGVEELKRDMRELLQRHLGGP
jgi:hypothetical protein